MTVELTAATHYLSAPAGSFWSWSDGGQVLRWTFGDGETLLFRAELCAVVARLAPSGLPPLEEILVLLSACRGSWRASQILFDLPWTDGERPERVGETLPEWLTELVAGLERIHALPPALRDSLESKSLIAEVVLESRPRVVSPAVAEAVQEILEAGPQTVSGDWSLSAGAFRKSLVGLSLALKGIDADLLTRRLRTGIDQELTPTDVTPPETESLREMLSRLSNDAELGGLARLAQQLIAVVQLPRAISDPDELQIGGVSDISNRGTLDRLLLSEMAHDDLTLAVRVAVNEALYLRRESPPKSPPEQRISVVDVGLRLWGVPRLFAASVALALAANSSVAHSHQSYATCGDSLTPLDLSTREGLMALLERLDPALDAAAVLPAVKGLIERAGGTPDMLLVTAAETFNDAAFQRTLAEQNLPPIFVATVHRAGEFQLWRCSTRGRRLLTEAKLDLEKILSPKSERPSWPLLDPTVSKHLPAIFKVRPFPLRLPHQVFAQNTVRIDSRTLLAFTRDGRLLQWDDVDKGARQIASHLPLGDLVWAEEFVDPKPRYRFLIAPASNSGLTLISVNFQNGEFHARPLDWKWGRPEMVFASGGALILRHWNSSRFVYSLLNLDSGAFLPQNVTKTFARSFVGRFEFWHGNPPIVHAVSNVGGRITKTPLDVHPSVHNRPELTTSSEHWKMFGHLVERPEHDGPFLLTRDTGELICLTHGTRRPISAGMSLPVHVHGFDREGRRALVEAGLRTAEALPTVGREMGRGRFLVDLETGRRTLVSSRVLSIAQYDAALMAFPKLVRKRFRAVLSTAGPSLILIANSGACWRISLEESRILLKAVPPQSPSAVKPFLLMDRNRRSYQLKIAEFAQARILLDSRGLLHLQSDDPGIPETTLILGAEEVSGWCADGRTWGDKYFFSTSPNAKPAVLFHEAIQPFARSLR